MAQDLNDLAHAAKSNITNIQNFNPADVLNSGSPIFSATGKQAMDAVKTAANSMDFTGSINGIRQNTAKLKKQFDDYAANGLPKTELTNTINAIKPQVNNILNTSNSALSTLSGIQAPASKAIGNISKMLDNYGYDNAVKDIMAGNYKNILTSSWENMMLTTSILGDMAAIKQKFGELKKDSKKIEDEIKTAGNTIKLSAKRAENLLNNFWAKAKRQVNQANIRDTEIKRFDKIVKSIGTEIKKLKLK
jgi:hypothetical protein